MRIGRVELRVSDVGVSAAFYARLVGLEARTLDARQAELGPVDGGNPILTLRRAERPGVAPRDAAGLFHTAFLFRERTGLGAALRRLADEMRHPLTGASDHGVSEALYLDDPDGLGIELYWDRPREDWPAPRDDERVRMFTEPLDIGAVAAADTGAPPAEASAGVTVGHAHLKVAAVDPAIEFWTGSVGMELMTTYGDQAAFLAADGYHHHVGANVWMSAGAPLEPAAGPGLDRVVVAFDGPTAEELTTPDGVPVLLEPEAA